jgi:GNAT superfamily N-acetyltransferase
VDENSASVEIRSERPGDAQWVVNQWARLVVRKQVAFVRRPDLPPFDKQLLRDEITWLAKQVTALSYLRIAVRDNSILGCAVLGEDTVHFVYVCEGERRKGLGARLISDVTREPWFFSSETPEFWAFARVLMRRGVSNGRFDPFKQHRLLATGSTVSPGATPIQPEANHVPATATVQ